MLQNYTKCILFIFCFVAAPASACFTPPEYLTESLSNLVGRTQNIVLAKALKYSDGKYSFVAVRTLKGTQLGQLSIDSKESPEKANATTFEGHQEKKFWEPNSFGRETNDADCKIYPAFEIGQTYLMFLNKPYHSKSFERIDTGSDKWLLAVEREIAKSQ
jgi:hypothetical protein